MNKRKISRLMRDRVSGLLSSGVYFFRGDFDQILQGVVLEYVPRGLYVWDFRFPLFDHVGPNLSFSNRLSGRSFIGAGEMSDDEIVDYVITSPEVETTFGGGSPMSTEQFNQILKLEYSDFPRAQLVRATGYVLQGRDGQAMELLTSPPPKLHPSNLAYFERLKASIGEGHQVALELVEEIRKNNLQAFNIA